MESTYEIFRRISVCFLNYLWNIYTQDIFTIWLQVNKCRWKKNDWVMSAYKNKGSACMSIYFNVLWIIKCYSSVKQVKSRKHDKQRTSCCFLNKTHTCRCKLIRFISWMNTNQHYDFMKKSAVYISSQLCTCNRIIPNK